MSGTQVRRLRLPPAGTSPAVARGEVASVLAETGLGALASEAALLTSELVTNGVMHAGTEVEVEIIADDAGLRVSVTDFGGADQRGISGGADQRGISGGADQRGISGGADQRGIGGAADVVVAPARAVAGVTAGGGTGPAAISAVALRGADVDRDGGRGLFLVAHFATRWGTTHERGTRRVWFHLDKVGHGAPTPTVASDRRPPAIDDILGALVAPDATGDGRRTPRKLDEVVDRLACALGAATATVTVDRADGRGPDVLARHASADPAVDEGRMLRVPLPLTRPWTGEVTLTGVRGRHADAVTTLMAGHLALLIENRRLLDAHDGGRTWLLFLAQAGELLARSMNVDLTVALLPRLVVPRLGDWCAVHLANEYGDLALAAVTHTDEGVIADLTRRLAEATTPLSRALAGDGMTPLGPPSDGMSFALTVRGERLGTLTVGRPANRPHSPDDLAVIEDLGRRAAVAIDNARIHDNSSRIASALQQSLLPPVLPAIDGLEVAAQYVPAGDGMDVGGDFYDIMPLPERGWMLVVGDVSGKGPGAAAVTGLVRDVLHTLAREHQDPEHTLSRLNASLVERGGGHFCTLALAFLTTVEPGVVELSLHLAGHDQPVVLRADGTTALVGECGTALGLMDKVTSPRVLVSLHRGDSLVFYTDGVTERRRGATLYGHDRMRDEISSLAGFPAAVLASQLLTSVLAFSPQQPRDDIAIVALRAL